MSSLRPTVLYIDDQIDHSRVVGDYLTVRGLDVMFAFDGQRAVQILDNTKVDLIFLDLHMPKMNGKEFLKYLSQKKIKTAVIVITGYPNEISSLEDGAFEIAGFFDKPVHLEELFEQTKRILGLG